MEKKTGYLWDSNGNLNTRGSDYVLDGETLLFTKSEVYTEYDYDLLNRLAEVRRTDKNYILNVIARVLNIMHSVLTDWC